MLASPLAESEASARQASVRQSAALCAVALRRCSAVSKRFEQSVGAARLELEGCSSGTAAVRRVAANVGAARARLSEVQTVLDCDGAEAVLRRGPGADGFDAALRECADAVALLSGNEKTWACAAGELKRRRGVLAAAAAALREAYGAVCGSFVALEYVAGADGGKAGGADGGRWRALRCGDDAAERARWLCACAVAADGGVDGGAAALLLRRAYAEKRAAEMERVFSAVFSALDRDAALGAAHARPYACGSHGLLRHYAFVRAALVAETDAVARLCTLRGAAGDVAKAVAPLLVQWLRAAAGAATRHIASAPGAPVEADRHFVGGSILARAEAARCALDLVARHMYHERPLLDRLAQLDAAERAKVFARPLVDVGGLLAAAAVDALVAATEACGDDAPRPSRGAEPEAPGLAADGVAALRRLASPPTRAAFSLLRARAAAPRGGDGARAARDEAPPWARDARGRAHSESVLSIRGLCVDFGYASMSDAPFNADGEAPRRRPPSGAARAIFSTLAKARTELKDLVTTPKHRAGPGRDAFEDRCAQAAVAAVAASHVSFEAEAAAMRPSWAANDDVGPASRPLGADDDESLCRDAVDFGRGLLGEVLRCVAKRAKVLRALAPRVPTLSTFEPSKLRSRLRIVHEEESAALRAADALGEARADLAVLVHARFLRVSLSERWDGDASAPQRWTASTASLLDSAANRFAAAKELLEFLAELEMAATASYCSAWRGAADAAEALTAAEAAQVAPQNLGADAQRLLKSRFARFNGHLDKLVEAQRLWRVDDAALRNSLRAAVVTLVFEPWRLFHAAHARKPFSAKNQDRYARWTPELVHANIQKLFSATQ
ncbi:hypothetical protein M885DRAFT_526013 [Pelagophyceae sp. CCMP2097]|nr:hypothetical protein M885DRAFT_526013 [Pelagophyceae sp. CCMP2097]